MAHFFLGDEKYPVHKISIESRNNDFDFFSGVLYSPSEEVKKKIGKGGHLYPQHSVKITDNDVKGIQVVRITTMNGGISLGAEDLPELPAGKYNVYVRIKNYEFDYIRCYWRAEGSDTSRDREQFNVPPDGQYKDIEWHMNIEAGDPFRRLYIQGNKDTTRGALIDYILIEPQTAGASNTLIKNSEFFLRSNSTRETDYVDVITVARITTMNGGISLIAEDLPELPAGKYNVYVRIKNYEFDYIRCSWRAEGSDTPRDREQFTVPSDGRYKDIEWHMNVEAGDNFRILYIQGNKDTTRGALIEYVTIVPVDTSQNQIEVLASNFRLRVGSSLESDSTDTIIFEGFLENVEEDGLNLILEGRDYKVLLLDESVPRNTTFTNLTGDQILQSLLNNSTKVDGSVIGSYTETIAGTLRFDNDNILRCVASVCEAHQKEFWVTYDGSNFRLNIGKRGKLSPHAFYAGFDLTITKTTAMTRDIVNRQMVFGAGDGVNQIRCCVPWMDKNDPDTARCAGFSGYNADCLHPASTASQSEFGIMEGKPYVDTSIKSLDVAINTAKYILDTALGKKLEIAFARYVPGLRVGDTLRIIDEKKDIDETARIKTISRKLDTRQMEVTFYDSAEEFESVLAKITRNSNLNDVQGVGATNIFQIQSYENCDENFPLNVRFYLHPDVVFVDKLEVNFNIKPYRAYHTALAAQGTHSHRTTITLNDFDSSQIQAFLPVYMLGAIDAGIGNDLIAWGRGITGVNESRDSSAALDHTHPIQFGISENVPLTDKSVTVEVNGTVIGTYTEDQTQLSIKDLIGDDRGWIDVSFVPRQPLRIEANVHCMVYIESEI